MVEAVLEERPVAAARHILGRLNVRPDPKLGELRERLADLARDQRDLVVSTRELAMAPVDGALMVGGNERYALREHAFGQLAAKLGIPAPYLRKCDPDLRARNVNRWLREVDRDVMLRFEGGEVRCVLSGAYRPINHQDILGWLESRLGENTPVRYELTEGYLDLQFVGPVETGMPLQPESDAFGLSVAPQPRRDPLHRGLHLRNSEVGLARVNISALVYRTICLNGLVMGAGRWAYQRRHVGKAEIGDQVREAFDHAIELSAQAVTAFAGTRGIQVKEPEKALDRIVTRYELAEDEGAAVKRAFGTEPGNSLFAVINALTRAGNDNALALESRHKLQTLGGRLTDLSAAGRWIDN